MGLHSKLTIHLDLNCTPVTDVQSLVVLIHMLSYHILR